MRYFHSHLHKGITSHSTRFSRVFSSIKRPSRCFSSSESRNIVTPRSENFSQWYRDVIHCAQLTDASPVRGCMIFRPHGYAIWEHIQQEMDARIKKTGVQNVYFPLMLPQSYLSKEAEHVEGFAKECAVITHHRLRKAEGSDGNNEGKVQLEPDPEAKLAEPLVVRPTSETLFWSAFKRWIHSHADLPLLINQWANVCRWEMKPRPFLRNSEFLWQEGHTAHATEHEARERAHNMLQVYRDFCSEVLALPVIAGEKSENEKFSGAVSTYTIEAILQNGWALQSGTSHFLGQNFSKAFDVHYNDADGNRCYPWATSWGVSTRLIGALIMAHSDDVGLILPPRVAPIQVVVTPLVKKKDELPQSSVLDKTKQTADTLKAHGYRVHLDDRHTIKPGNRFFEWDRKGVPLRIEIGQKEIEQDVVCLKARNRNERTFIQSDSEEDLATGVGEKLQSFHTELYESASRNADQFRWRPDTYKEVVDAVQKGDLQGNENTGFGYIEVPWHDSVENEARVKEDTKLTLRCYPFDRQQEANGKKCFYSKRPATNIAVFARAY